MRTKDFIAVRAIMTVARVIPLLVGKAVGSCKGSVINHHPPPPPPSWARVYL